MANQGSYFSGVATFTLAIIATQTGTHTLRYRTPDNAWLTEEFEGTNTVAFVIPNVFNEHGRVVFEIVQPDGVLFDDGSLCAMSLEIRTRGCAP